MRRLSSFLAGLLFASAAYGQALPSPIFKGLSITGAGGVSWLGGGWATTVIPSSKMAVDNVVENNATNSIVNSAYNWSANTYTFFGVSRDFGTPFSGTGSPANAFMAYAVNNGASNDVVAAMSMCRVMSNVGMKHCFGGNDVVTADAGITSPVLIGREIDVQTASASVTPSAISAGLYINFFTSAFNGARGILINTLNGATLDTGLQIAGTITGNQIKGTNFTIDPNNNFRTAGFYGTNGYQPIGNNSGNYLAWNKTGGGGEADFINHNAGAGGGWFWYDTANGSTFTQAMVLSKTGTLTATEDVVATRNVIAGGSVQFAKKTVGTLPACNSGAEGSIYAITDSGTTTFNATLTGSGSNHVMGYCNGTNWTVH